MIDPNQLSDEQLIAMAQQMGMFDAPPGPNMIGGAQDPRSGLIPSQPIGPPADYAQFQQGKQAERDAMDYRKPAASEVGGLMARGMPLVGPWMDEAAAAFDATRGVGEGDWKQRYQEGVNLYRGRDAAVDEATGKYGDQAKMLGMMIGGAPMIPLATPLSGAAGGMAGLGGTAARAGAGALEGGVLGFGHGAGEGTGGITDPSRLKAGGELAVPGALAGAAAPALMEGGAAVWNQTGRRIGNALGRKVEVGGPAPTPAAPPSGGQGQTDALVDALATIQASPRAAVPRSSSNEAYERLARALRRQDMTGPDAAKATEALGPHGMIADTGEATRDLGRAVMNTGSKGAVQGKQALELRQRGTLEDGTFTVRPASRRVADQVSEGMGVGGRNSHEEIAAAAKRQKEAAGPAYRKAYAAAPLSVRDLSEFTASPDFAQAYARARRISEKEFVKQADGSEIIVPLPEKMPTTLDWRTLDLMKQGLDDMRRDLTSGIGRNEQGALKEYLRRFTTRLDEINPDYKVARDGFAGESRFMEAVDEGRAFMKEDAEEIASGFAKMSPSEQEAFRIGAARQVRDRLEGKPTGYDVARQLLTPAQLKRFEEVFPDRESFASTMRQVQNEQTMFDTRTALTGNSSSAKQLLAATEEAPLESAATTAAASGSVMAGVGQFIRQTVKGGRMSEPTADALAAIILNMDKRNLPQVLQGLSDAERRLLLSEALRRTGAGAGAQAGVNLGGN